MEFYLVSTTKNGYKASQDGNILRRTNSATVCRDHFINGKNNAYKNSASRCSVLYTASPCYPKPECFCETFQKPKWRKKKKEDEAVTIKLYGKVFENFQP